MMERGDSPTLHPLQKVNRIRSVAISVRPISFVSSTLKTTSTFIAKAGFTSLSTISTTRSIGPLNLTWTVKALIPLLPMYPFRLSRDDWFSDTITRYIHTSLIPAVGASGEPIAEVPVDSINFQQTTVLPTNPSI